MLKLTLGEFQSNCYLLFEGNTAFVIDPGAEGEKIGEVLRASGVENVKIIITHCHIDHWGASNFLIKNFQSELYAGEKEKEFCQSPDYNLSFYLGGVPFPDVDKWVKEDDLIGDGEIKLKVLETPGHTLGGISLVNEDKIFTGDTLFAGSVGRCDLLGGNFESLIKSIKKKLFILPDEMKLHPGHGEDTTIGAEKRENPFLK